MDNIEKTNELSKTKGSCCMSNTEKALPRVEIESNQCKGCYLCIEKTRQNSIWFWWCLAYGLTPVEFLKIKS